jgi:hypothetical protein
MDLKMYWILRDDLALMDTRRYMLIIVARSCDICNSVVDIS